METYLSDMELLEKFAPEVHNNFIDSNFVVKIAKKVFQPSSCRPGHRIDKQNMQDAQLENLGIIKQGESFESHDQNDHVSHKI